MQSNPRARRRASKAAKLLRSKSQKGLGLEHEQQRLLAFGEQVLALLAYGEQGQQEFRSADGAWSTSKRSKVASCRPRQLRCQTFAYRRAYRCSPSASNGGRLLCYACSAKLSTSAAHAQLLARAARLLRLHSNPGARPLLGFCYAKVWQLRCLGLQEATLLRLLQA